MKISNRPFVSFLCRLAFLVPFVVSAGASAQTVLSDIPLFSASNVPANLMLALSVEWPTGVVAAYTDAAIPLVYTNSAGVTQQIYCGGLNSSNNNRGYCYSSSMNYLGYFDYNKCYTYSTTTWPYTTTSWPQATSPYYTTTNPNNGTIPYGVFVPSGTNRSNGSECPTGKNLWSGNMLNWATMTKLDEFRQSLTGGYRIVDTASMTILQRARNTAQGGSGSPPTRQIGSGNPSCTTPSGYAGCAAANSSALIPTVIGDATFASAKNVYLRSNNGGTELTNGSAAADRGVFIQIADNTCFLNQTSNSTCGTASANHMVQYYVRVQVCVSGALESNCNSAHASTDYPGAGAYDKPEGLIQQNYQRIRVGVAAYVRSSGVSQPNGMLRALLHDNGPTTYNGFGVRQSNTSTSALGGQTEWDGISGGNTGVFTANPDPNSASASKVTASGAINYLNQFGLIESSYESNDTLAELYWSALAYYKNLSLDSSFTSGLSSLTATQLDNFPAILSGTSNGANDPVQYSCQGNNIVTLGDSHTWYDTAVPGGYNFSVSGHAPLAALPASGSDPGLNTQTYLSALGKLPVVEAYGSTAASSSMNTYAGKDISTTTVVGNGTSGDTYNIAGMAYYAHTQNIRPDLTDSNHDKQGDAVTVDTYTVDVMEPGPFDGSTNNPTYNPGSLSSGDGPNQYWLAAKYGGFDVDQTQCPIPLYPNPVAPPSCTSTPTSFLSWHTNTTTAAAQNLRPDNYYPGNRPDLMQSGLAQIFNKLSSTKQLSASAPGISSGRLLSPVTPSDSIYQSPVGGFPIYQTNYKPGDWTGELTGYVGVVSGNSVQPVTGTVTWSAQQQLDNLVLSANSSGTVVGWNTGRRVVTYNPSTKKGVAFRYANLSTSQQSALPGDTASSSPLLNFLRGDKSNEGSLFRVRRHVLGDIVDSSAVLVQGALSPSYSDATNPGYSAYVTSVKSRAPVVYTGANDGMLHAFAGDFSQPTATNPLTGGGSELFAYIPSLLFNGPSTPATPSVNGLAALANLSGVTTNVYSHHFYVDQTPVAADVDFDWTCPTAGTACAAGTVPNWHTVLAGSLGKGGKGIYALDITTTPAAVAQTTGTTLETTIANQVLWEFTDSDMGFTYGRPVFAKTRKYGWVVLITSGYNNTSGNGHLYVLNAQTGTLLERLDTPTSVGSPSNPSGLGRASAYTQDLTDGTIEQVYAGDLLGNVWRFDLSASSGAYPAPTLLATLTDPSNNPQPITTAPGVELDIGNAGLTTRRWVFVGTGKFLATSDLTNNQQQTMYALRDGSGSAPSTTGLPLTRSVLVQTDLLTASPLSDSASGWYYDLLNKAPVTGGATERIVVDPDAVAGSFVVAWTSMVPTGDPCAYHGAIYAAGFGSAATALTGTGGSALVSATTTSGAPTGVEIVQTPGGTSYSILVPSTSVKQPPMIQNLTGGISNSALYRTNWREVFN